MDWDTRRTKAEVKRDQVWDEVTRAMDDLSRSARQPYDEALFCRLLADEAAANARDHGRGSTVLVSMAIALGIREDSLHRGRGRMSLCLTYASARFDPGAHGPQTSPALLSERGRGINLMKELTSETGGCASWRFSDPLVHVRLTRYWSA